MSLLFAVARQQDATYKEIADVLYHATRDIEIEQELMEVWKRMLEKEAMIYQKAIQDRYIG